MVKRLVFVMSVLETLAVGPAFSQGGDSLYTLATIVADYPHYHLGHIMSGAGDFNGDGFADLLVGDPAYNANECRVYLGGTTISEEPAVIIPPPETHPDFEPSDFGRVVSGGHDVNGDGYDDIVITNQVWYYATGKIYLYYGGPEFDLEPDVAIAGFGSSWYQSFWSKDLRGRLVGDMNGDGCDELACLVYSIETGAYVYFGGAPMDSIHDFGSEGPGYPFLDMGNDISSGDLNGDGYGDLAVSAYAAENHPEVQDAAWIYFGGPDPDDMPDLALSPERTAYGYTVCIPGDLNGDGFEDVAVGPNQYTEEGVTDYGCLHVYFGSARMDNVADLSIPGRVWRGRYEITGGDLNGDGYADLVTSQFWSSYNFSESWLCVYYGGAEMDTIPDIEIFGPDCFGKALAWIGDMNGDGWPEFAVSEPAGSGTIYIYTLAAVSGGVASVIHPAEMQLRIVPNPSRGPTAILRAGGSGIASLVRVYDMAGHVVRTLPADGASMNWSSLVWDGTDSEGRAVCNGTYIVRVMEGARPLAERVTILR